MGERLAALRRANRGDDAALGRALWTAFAEGASDIASDLGAWIPMMKACPAPDAAVAVRFLDAITTAVPAIEADVWLPLFDPLLETPGLAEALSLAGPSRGALGYGLARAGLVDARAIDPAVLPRVAEQRAGDPFDAGEFAKNARIWPDGAWERAILAAALEMRHLPRELVAACWAVATAEERVRLALAGDPVRLFAPLGEAEGTFLAREARALAKDPSADADRALRVYLALARAAPKLAAAHEDLVVAEVLRRRGEFGTDPAPLTLDALAAITPERRDALLANAVAPAAPSKDALPWVYLQATRTSAVIEKAVLALAALGELGESHVLRSARRAFAQWGDDAIAPLEAALAKSDAAALRDMLAFLRVERARPRRPAPESAWKDMPDRMREQLGEAWRALEADPEGDLDLRYQLRREEPRAPIPRILRDEAELARAAELRPDLAERLQTSGGVIAAPADAVLLPSAPFASARLTRLLELDAPEIILLSEIRRVRREEECALCTPEDLLHLPSDAARAPNYGRMARLCIGIARFVLPVWTARFPDDPRPARVIADAASFLEGRAPTETATRDALHREAYAPGADGPAYRAARSAIYAHDEATQHDSDEQDTPGDLAVGPWAERATWAGATPEERRRAFWTWLLEEGVPASFRDA